MGAGLLITGLVPPARCSCKLQVAVVPAPPSSQLAAGCAASARKRESLQTFDLLGDPIMFPAIFNVDFYFCYTRIYSLFSRHVLTLHLARSILRIVHIIGSLPSPFPIHLPLPTSNFHSPKHNRRDDLPLAGGGI